MNKDSTFVNREGDLNKIREQLLIDEEERCLKHTIKVCDRFEKRIKRLRNDIQKMLETDKDLYDIDRLWLLSTLYDDIDSYIDDIETDKELASE